MGVLSCFRTLLFSISIVCLSSLSTGADIGIYFTQSPQSIVAPPGDQVTFQCETNIPAEQVRWKLNGRFLHQNESDIHVSGNLLSVKLPNVNFDHFVGDYQCVCDFGPEALTSLPAQLSIAPQLNPFQQHSNKTLEAVEVNTVAIPRDAPYSNPPQGMPNITKEPMNLIVEEGGEAIFDCVSEGLPKPRVYWVFNGQNVVGDGNVQITDWGLRIGKVGKRHAGLFQCFATNPVGTVTSPAELKVMAKQITATDRISVTKPPVAASVATSVLPPPPSVTDRENHGLASFHHHHRNDKLHTGKHKKRRKHKAQVMTPPSKPTINRLSDESVMIRWQVSPNRGYPIQFFKVQYAELSRKPSHWMTIDEDIPPHVYSYEVRDLKSGHAYRFRIAAVYSNNDNKVGPNSEKFVLQKDSEMRPRYAPVITSAVPHNTSAILLGWKVMKSEMSGLDGYFIYYREATSAGEYTKVTVVGAETESHYINHLKIGTVYDIKIQAFNPAGASSFSSIISAKTTGTATTTERSNYENGRYRKDEHEIIIPEEMPPPKHSLYTILAMCLLFGFLAFFVLVCTFSYRCKQKRKDLCDVQLDLKNKSIANDGHAAVNGHVHGLGAGYIPTIASQLDEKETSFMERDNNNRPIPPPSYSHINGN